MVGLRPFRPEGFRLAAEQVGGTFVVHNYGHGGGGVTLSWGCAALAVELASPLAGQRCAVIGAGAVGLATARTLQERGAGPVTIYAEAVSPGTVSDDAGAQVWPSFVFDRDRITPAFAGRYERAAAISFARFGTMVGPRYGVSWRRNYALSDPGPVGPSASDPDPALSLAPFCISCGQLGESTSPFRTLRASTFDTMMVTPPIYLPALRRDVERAGGGVVLRRLRDRRDVAALPERLVFNCTGLGAGALFGDATLTPVKGELAVLPPQRALDYNLLYRGSYMFPRDDGVLLGGLEGRGDWSLDWDRVAERRIVGDLAEATRDLRPA